MELIASIASKLLSSNGGFSTKPWRKSTAPLSIASAFCVVACSAILEAMNTGDTPSWCRLGR
jgi:hypothetical protein